MPAAQLPPGFPSPSEVTYTGEREIGPSQSSGATGMVTSGPLSTATRVREGTTDYSITKEEREDVDAEVNFSGQRLRTDQAPQSCKDRTDVTITIRPS